MSQLEQTGAAIVVKQKRGPGRPCKRDWEAERPVIELLIRAGYGYPAIARHYGLSPLGARKMLQRLGLRTHRQEQWAKERGGDGTAS